ncbi:hypothetical protein DL96DRAFT_1620832 [Flagelloscypha sp. PMI_526]|nr:hypothetical protein DL96DRAFT_1620832 [Flagelloscypha sp. PMI_526]
MTCLPCLKGRQLAPFSVPPSMSELPPELWEKIFEFGSFSKLEVLRIRLVCKAFTKGVYGGYFCARTVDLSVAQLADWKQERGEFVSKIVQKALLSSWHDGQWIESLVITPYFELIDLAAVALAQTRTRQKALSSSSWSPFGPADKMAKDICRRISPLPNCQKAAIIESPALETLLKTPRMKSIAPRCSYIDILWTDASRTLTTLELSIATEMTWSMYCPKEQTLLPSLRTLRIQWKAHIQSRGPLVLLSKAPNLEGLTLFQPPSLILNDLPRELRSLPRLRAFRWVDPLKEVALQTSRIPGIENALPFATLNSLSLNVSEGHLYAKRDVLLQRLETKSHTLQNLTLQCATWGDVDIEKLLRTLGRLPSLRSLTVLLPFYSNKLLGDLAKVTIYLDSLRIISGTFRLSAWTPPRAMVSYQAFARDIECMIGHSALARWKLRDLTIRGPKGDSASSSILCLHLAIAKVVPSITSFYGSGHMRAAASAMGIPNGIGEDEW